MGTQENGWEHGAAGIFVKKVNFQAKYTQNEFGFQSSYTVCVFFRIINAPSRFYVQLYFDKIGKRRASPASRKTTKPRRSTTTKKKNKHKFIILYATTAASLLFACNRKVPRRAHMNERLPSESGVDQQKYYKYTIFTAKTLCLVACATTKTTRTRWK